MAVDSRLPGPQLGFNKLMLPTLEVVEDASALCFCLKTLGALQHPTQVQIQALSPQSLRCKSFGFSLSYSEFHTVSVKQQFSKCTQYQQHQCYLGTCQKGKFSGSTSDFLK